MEIVLEWAKFVTVSNSPFPALHLKPLRLGHSAEAEEAASLRKTKRRMVDKKDVYRPP